MMPVSFPTPADVMRRALELARLGEGSVEPNPLVGAVLVDDHLQCLGEGFHREFGGPHAEVHALREAGASAAGGTLYVTLEPCSHHGKTPPCVDAILQAGVSRVVVGMQDPFAKVNGAGIARLREHGVVVDVGLLEPEVRRLNAPFRKLVESGLPWVHAKWAMSLDGKIATRTGHSQWISGAASRALVHRLRGRVDAIIVGIGTALVDDPQLTARPAGPRVATRVVFDSTARLPLASKLVATAREIPLLVATAESAPAERVAALRAAGAEVLAFAAEPGETGPSPAAVLRELGGRRSTNVLIEGGSRLLGAFYDRQLIDEAHVFVGAKLLGGEGAKSPLGGMGRAEVPALPSLEDVAIEIIEGDIYVRGFARRD